MAHSLSLANSTYSGVKCVVSDKLFQKKKFRKEKEFARRKAKKSPYETILIVCEDSKSSPNYFRAFIQHYRLNAANVIIMPSRGSAPISVVDYSIELARTILSIDRVACVFDRDNHASYEQAIDKLKSQKPKRGSKTIYQAIASTPCFELWLLLHFCYTTKSYTYTGKKSAADNLNTDLLKELPSYNKANTNWFNDLIIKTNSAIKNAKKLQEHNNKTDSTNPTTNMHELIEYLMNLKTSD